MLSRGIWLCLMLAVGPPVSMADVAVEDAVPFKGYVGEKIWYADNGQQHALLGGIGVSFRFPPQMELAGEFLRGVYHNDGDRERHHYFRGGVHRVFQRGYVGMGFSYQQIHTRLKSGWIWEEDREEERERNADIYGPFVAAGLNGRFGRSPFGWRVAGFWMLRDFGELDDMGYDGSHAALEGALTAQWKKLLFSGGYRNERYRDLPPRLVNGVPFGRNRVDGAFFTAGICF